MKSLTAIEPKHIAPLEFGEGIAQFLLEKSNRPGNGPALPLIIWVEAAPTKSRNVAWLHPLNCQCEFVYAVTLRSVDFLKQIRYRLADPTGDDVMTCPCMGRFVE